MERKALDFLWKKQEVTADNLANLDTPIYKKKSLNFEDTFRSKLQAASRTGDTKKIAQAIHESKWQVTSYDSAARVDGNNVNADFEYAELSRTALQYQYLTQTVGADISRYRSAVKGQ